MRKLDFYWASNKDWYHWEGHKQVINEDAPPEAKESYEHYLKQVAEATSTHKRIDTDLDTYKRLIKCLSEIAPDVEVKLVEADYALKELGFSEKTPCTIEVNADNYSIRDLADLGLEYEIDYADNEDDKEAYELYRKYGWLYDFFSEAANENEY